MTDKCETEDKSLDSVRMHISHTLHASEVPLSEQLISGGLIANSYKSGERNMRCCKGYTHTFSRQDSRDTFWIRRLEAKLKSSSDHSYISDIKLTLVHNMLLHAVYLTLNSAISITFTCTHYTTDS